MLRLLRCALLALMTLLCVPAWGAKSVADIAEDGETNMCKSAVMSWLGNAGKLGSALDDGVIDPLVEYFTTTEGTSAEAELQRRNAKMVKTLEGVVKLTCNACGVVIDGGRIIVGQSVMLVEDFYEQGRRISAARMVFGGSKPIDAYLGAVDRMFASASFFDDFVSRRSPAITPDNLSKMVRSEDALHRLWFTDYRRFLLSRFGGLRPMEDEIDNALKGGWSFIERYWRAQRAGEVLDKLSDSFLRLRAPCTRSKPSAARLQCPMANAEPVWREAEKREVCWCKPGYLWNAAGSSCILEPAAQVAAIRCEPGAEPTWSREAEQVMCQCKPGLEWNRAHSACIPDVEAQLAAARCEGNAEPHWDLETERVQCRCPAGKEWNRAHDACVAPPAAQVAAARCQPNAEAYWNEELDKVRCRCIGGHAWNGERTACVPDAKAQLALAACDTRYPNSEAYWDLATQKAACRCKAGFVWSREQAACAAPEKPDADMQKLLDDVASNQGDAVAATQRERAAAADREHETQLADAGPSALRQRSQEPGLMGTLLQTLTAAVAQSQGVPRPAALALPGMPVPALQQPSPSRAAPAAKPAPPGRAAEPAAASRGGDEYYMMIGSALPSTNEHYQKYPACRYMRPWVRSAVVSHVAGGKAEIEAAAAALRSRRYQSVEVRYYPDSQQGAPFQEWDRAEEAGRDACWKATHGGGK